MMRTNHQRPTFLWVLFPWHTAMMIAFGGLPAMALLVLAFGLAKSSADPAFKVSAVLGLLGVIGIWMAAFINTTWLTRRGIVVGLLLICGLVAVAPFSGAMLIGMTKNPLELREVAKYWFSLWLFFGPLLCALYYIGRQLVASVIGNPKTRRNSQPSPDCSSAPPSILPSSSERAGRVFHLLGWINIALTIFGGIVVFRSAPEDDHAAFALAAALFAVTLALSIGYFIVRAGLKKGRRWARSVGVALALVTMLYAPIGTLIGVIALVYLAKCWNERAIAA